MMSVTSVGTALGSDDDDDLFFDDADDAEDDDHVIEAVADMLGGDAQRTDWYNDPNRPKTLDAGLAKLGVHVEHFTRFEEEQVRMLIATLAVPDFVYVKG
jgi:hypothetical protein